MAFFNEFKDKFNKAAQSVTNKTKDGVEITRLGSEARSINNELSSLYEKIGRVFVESKGQDYDAMRPLVERVLELKDRLEEIEAQRLQLKSQYPCPVCGAIVSKGARFCSGCGRRLIEPEAEASSQVINRKIVVDSAEEPTDFNAD